MKRTRIGIQEEPLGSPQLQWCYAYGLAIAFAMWAALGAAVTLI